MLPRSTIFCEPISLHLLSAWLVSYWHLWFPSSEGTALHIPTSNQRDPKHFRDSVISIPSRAPNFRDCSAALLDSRIESTQRGLPCKNPSNIRTQASNSWAEGESPGNGLPGDMEHRIRSLLWWDFVFWGAKFWFLRCWEGHGDGLGVGDGQNGGPLGVWSHVGGVDQSLRGAAVRVYSDRSVAGGESVDEWVHHCPSYREF